MFCSKCGFKNNDAAVFCAQCGVPFSSKESVEQASPPSEALSGGSARGMQPGNAAMRTRAARPRWKKKGLVIGIAAAVIVVAGAAAALLLTRPGILGGSSSIAAVHESNFSSPESAIRHFVSSVAANDLSGALSACAVNEEAKNYNLEAEIKQEEAITVFVPAPAQYPFDSALDQAYFLGNLTLQIKNFTYSFADSAVVKNYLSTLNYPINPQSDPNAAEKFVKAVNPANIRGLKIVRIDEPSRSVLNNSQTVSNFKKRAQLYGADEMTERVALYELNGKYFYGGFQVLHYNKGWKIINLFSNIANMTPYGEVEKIDPKQYANMAAG